MYQGYNLVNEWYLMSHEVRPSGTANSQLHYHHSYEIFVMVSGHTTVLINDKLIELSANDLLLLKPDEIHKNKGTEQHERYAVHFTEKYMLNYYSQKSANMFFSLFDNTKRSFKSEAFMQVLNLLRSMEKNPDMAFIHIGEILSMLISKENLINVKQKSCYPLIEQVLEYVHKNYASIYKLDDIADAVHISKQYLCSIFKRETGATVSEYINNVRINNACELLRSENMSITEISGQCGYNSPMYFCKMFKELVHMTPNEYRKYMRNE